jgi:POT family proton-dependent oligopeptide transporter
VDAVHEVSVRQYFVSLAFSTLYVNIPANFCSCIASLGENAVGHIAHSIVEPTGNQRLSDEKRGHHPEDEKVVDPESHSISSHEVVDHEAYPAPTAEERTTLRKVHDIIPIAAWSLCIVEVGERAS